MTIIGRQLVVNGEVSCDDDLTIEGTVQGFVSARDGTVTIETPARVEADVRAARVLVRGDVRGAISASERIELGPSSTVEGSLSAGLIAMVEGAQFNGTIDMNRRTIAARVAEYRPAAPPSRAVGRSPERLDQHASGVDSNWLTHHDGASRIAYCGWFVCVVLVGVDGVGTAPGLDSEAGPASRPLQPTHGANPTPERPRSERASAETGAHPQARAFRA